MQAEHLTMRHTRDRPNPATADTVLGASLLMLPFILVPLPPVTPFRSHARPAVDSHVDSSPAAPAIYDTVYPCVYRKYV